MNELGYPKHSTDNTEHINNRSKNTLSYWTNVYLENFLNIFEWMYTLHRKIPNSKQTSSERAESENYKARLTWPNVIKETLRQEYTKFKELEI